jgi:hypothetical protein
MANSSSRNSDATESCTMANRTHSNFNHKRTKNQRFKEKKQNKKKKKKLSDSSSRCFFFFFSLLPFDFLSRLSVQLFQSAPPTTQTTQRAQPNAHAPHCTYRAAATAVGARVERRVERRGPVEGRPMRSSPFERTRIHSIPVKYPFCCVGLSRHALNVEVWFFTAKKKKKSVEMNSPRKLVITAMLNDLCFYYLLLTFAFRFCFVCFCACADCRRRLPR